jgi:hypothetical protein
MARRRLSPDGRMATMCGRARRSDALLAGTLLAAALLAGCDVSRPHPIVICHNANCGEPTDPERDDTLAAFRESLGLIEYGRPVIDGIELDSFWRGSDDVCLYAHDPSNFAENTPATAPAEELANHFARPGPITFADTPFFVLLELKSHVSANTKDRHTPAQALAHARCAWDIYDIIAKASIAHEREVTIEFQAFSPELLRAVLQTAPASTPVPFALGALQGVPSPLDDQTRPLRDYTGLPITDVQFHPLFMQDAQHEAALRSGAKVSFFWFSTTSEVFAAIRRFEPFAVDTSEARLMRRWLER